MPDVEYLGGVNTDENRSIHMYVTRKGSIGLAFERKFKMADIEGLSNKAIQNGELVSVANRKRVGDKVITRVSLTREGAFALRQLLDDFLK